MEKVTPTPDSEFTNRTDSGQVFWREQWMNELGGIWWRGECTKPKPLMRESSPDSMKFIYALLSSLIHIKERSFSRMLCQETGCVLKSTGHRFRNWDSSPYSFTWLQGGPEGILMSWDLLHLSYRMRRQSPMTFLLGSRF